MCSATRKRKGLRGLSLVELLVVIAVISLLVQLLLPAVQSAREAARRTICQSHLHQICIGGQAHESSHRFLPGGGINLNWIGDADAGFGGRQSGSWAFSLLPYIEESSTFDLTKGNVGDEQVEAGTELAGAVVALLHCPSRRPAQLYSSQSEGGGTNFRTPLLVARSDFAANCGDVFVGFKDASGAVRDAIDPEEQGRFTGVIFHRSEVRTAEIRRGLSSTYFVGEKWVWFSDYESGLDSGDDDNAWVGYDVDSLRFTRQYNYLTASGEPEISNYPPRPDRESGEGIGFGSAHPSGLHMAFCDGAVRFVSYDVDPEIHRISSNRDHTVGDR